MSVKRIVASTRSCSTSAHPCVSQVGRKKRSNCSSWSPLPRRRRARARRRRSRAPHGRCLALGLCPGLIGLLPVAALRRSRLEGGRPSCEDCSRPADARQAKADLRARGLISLLAVTSPGSCERGRPNCENESRRRTAGAAGADLRGPGLIGLLPVASLRGIGTRGNWYGRKRKRGGEEGDAVSIHADELPLALPASSSKVGPVRRSRRVGAHAVSVIVITLP
jgi:hypothetical protein